MPKPLFTKLVAQAAIGFFCVLFGSIYALHTKDRIFLIMSLLIGLCCLIRSMSLFRLIQKQYYYALEGLCSKKDQLLFHKNQQIVIIDKDGKEYTFTMDKRVRLLQGHYYRLFFRKPPFTPFDNATPPSVHDYLGMEEISPF